MHSEEKEYMKNSFVEEKHHLVTAVNILMYFQRHAVLVMEKEGPNQGKKFVWNH